MAEVLRNIEDESSGSGESDEDNKKGHLQLYRGRILTLDIIIG